MSQAITNAQINQDQPPSLDDAKAAEELARLREADKSDAQWLREANARANEGRAAKLQRIAENRKAQIAEEIAQGAATAGEKIDFSNVEEFKERHGGNAHTDTPALSPISVRDQKMAEIAERRREAIEREVERGRQMAANPLSGQEIVQPEAHANEPIGNRLMTINLDGNEFQVTPEQYKTLADFGARAGTGSLVQQQQQSQFQAQRAAQIQAQQHLQMQQQQAAAAAAAQAQSYERYLPYAERLQWGSKEEIAQTLHAHEQDLMRRAAQQADARAAQMVQAMAAQANVINQGHAALGTLRQEFPEIVASTALSQLALINCEQMEQYDRATYGQLRGQPIDYYRAAFQRVRDELAPHRQQSAPQPQPQRAQSAPQRAAPVIERPRPRQESGPPGYNPSDVVAALRKARGQQ